MSQEQVLYPKQDPEFEQHHSALMQSFAVSSSLSGLSPYDNDSVVDALLERYDFTYILGQVKKTAHLLNRVAHPAILDLELEDIAQEVHIHFWQKLQTAPIEKPEAYIRQMIYHAYADVIRHHKRHGVPVQLPTTPDGELSEGKVLATPGKGMADPQIEFEEESALFDSMSKVINAILALPPQQQRAIACSVLEQIDDPIQFISMLKICGVDIRIAKWPHEKTKKRLLKASISAARRSVARSINIDLKLYKEKGASFFNLK